MALIATLWYWMMIDLQNVHIDVAYGSVDEVFPPKFDFSICKIGTKTNTNTCEDSEREPGTKVNVVCKQT